MAKVIWTWTHPVSDDYSKIELSGRLDEAGSAQFDDVRMSGTTMNGVTVLTDSKSYTLDGTTPIKKTLTFTDETPVFRISGQDWEEPPT